MSLLTSLINNVMGQTVSEAKTETEPSDADGTDNGNPGMKNTESDMIPHMTTTKHSGVKESCNRGLLEWEFLDFTKAKRSPIFDVDPVMLKKFIGHNVTVMSKSRQEFRGCCLAIDPVSLSVILAQRILTEKIRVITVPGYYLSKITVDASSVPSENRVSVNDLDVAELYHALSLYSDGKKTQVTDTNSLSTTRSKTPEPQECHLAPVPSEVSVYNSISQSQNMQTNYSPDEIIKRKERLIDLLMKHRMPVTIKGDDLEMPGGVKIKPPYTVDTCETTNLMIKKKIGELIKSI